MIYKTNCTLSNLNEMKDDFYLESFIIQKIKCDLMRNDEIEDFEIKGIHVNVYPNNEGYDLYYQNSRIELIVYDKQIIDYRVNG